MSEPNSNIQERPKALELLQLLLMEKYYDGTCDVAIVGKSCYKKYFNYFFDAMTFDSLFLSLFIDLFRR